MNNTCEQEKPDNIKPKWFSVIRRLQSVAKSEGLSIIKIHILCDKDGDPIGWIAPEQIKIEPKSGISAIFKMVDRF